MAGSISFEEFQRCATQLVELSDKLIDGWTFHRNTEDPQASYLVKKVIISDTEEKSSVPGSVNSLEEPLEQDLEDASAIAETRSEVLTWEYHLLYSQSYSVPTLYFNAWTSDGRLLSLDEMWNRAHSKFQGALQGDRWSVLTQQEHPVLRRPFYWLHPCRTVEFLSCFQGKSSNIVITWLSTVGPTIGLNLSPKYGFITTPSQ